MARVVIVGGGPGGYESALVAAQLGAEVVVVDSDGVGGSAVLTDCVPSKTLIATAEVMTDFGAAGELGIVVDEPRVDLARINERVKALALAQSADIEGRLAREGVTVVHGRGRLDGPSRVVATHDDGTETTYTYDEAGRISGVDQGSNSESWGWTATGVTDVRTGDDDDDVYDLSWLLPGQLASVEHNGAPIVDIEYSPGGRLVAASAGDEGLSPVGSLDWSPDGRLLSADVGDDSADQTAALRQRFQLTAREAEVLLWIARGKANRDIGEILSLSPRTVNKHLEQIYMKLGVENRASAAVAATRALDGG